ncbi:MAG: hypothetical protein ACXVHS_06620 [Methanobacterium sp.]
MGIIGFIFGAIFLGVSISIMINNWIGVVAGALLGTFMGCGSGYGKTKVEQKRSIFTKTINILIYYFFRNLETANFNAQ